MPLIIRAFPCRINKNQITIGLQGNDPGQVLLPEGNLRGNMHDPGIGPELVGSANPITVHRDEPHFQPLMKPGMSSNFCYRSSLADSGSPNQRDYPLSISSQVKDRIITNPFNELLPPAGYILGRRSDSVLPSWLCLLIYKWGSAPAAGGARGAFRRNLRPNRLLMTLKSANARQPVPMDSWTSP